MSARSRRRAALSSAKASALLSVLPQSQALSQLLRSTDAQYSSDIAQTKSYAASVRANALSQVNPLRAALQPILDQQRQDQATSAARLAAIGPGGSDYAASAAREAQAANARLSGTQAGAVTELNSRASDALAGGQYALTNLASKHTLDRQKIADQIAGLAQQQGLTQSKAFQDTLQSLRQQDITLAGVRGANKRADASLQETTRHNRATEKTAAENAAKSPKGPKGSRPTRKDRVSAHTQFEKGVSIAATLHKGGKDKKGKPIPPASKDEMVTILSGKVDPIIAQASVQQVLYGGVNERTRRIVHHRYGVKLAPIPARVKIPNPLHLPGLSVPGLG